jgi:hypothetical protein
MPAKTKKKTASRPRSTVTKSRQVSTSRFNKKSVLIVVAVLAVIGAFIMFRASAATSNFEAETATRNALVSAPVTDSAASGGKYVTFAQPATAVTAAAAGVQRFPGDPNPLVTGKTYWGSSYEGGVDPNARHEVPTGKPLPLRRKFFGWGDRATSMPDTAKSDLAKGRLPWVSIKPPSWADMAAGKYDGQIDEMLIALDNVGGPNKPVWFTVHHEPEGGGGSINGGPDDLSGATGWRNMQKRIRTRINALKAQGKPMDNIAFAPILMGYTFDTSSKRNPEDWWVDGIWDFYGIDVYCYESCSSRGRTIVTTPPLAASVAFVKSKNIPIGIGEWGETNTATVWAQAMRQFWEYGFKNKVDLVGYSAFDSGLNPPAGTTVDTTMPKEVLTVFHDILKNDQRVMRVAELGSSSSTGTSTTSYGTVTSNLEVPENGTYKLWVRMNAPNDSNNAVQAQIDTGAVVKMGDAGVPANAWTWVDWKNGDTTNKVSFALNAGSRKVTLTGIEAGVKIDRVLLTNETCAPTDKGDLCALATPPTPTALKVSVSGITNGSPVTGVIPIKVTADRAITDVSFRPDNVWSASDNSSPYEFSWDTRSVSNGAHALVIRARADGDPGDVYTQTVLNVTVNNATTTTPPPPPVDTTKPTVPTSLRANLVFDWAKLKYVMNLDWDPSYDSVGVTGYQITRNGTVLGTSKTTGYADATNLSAGQIYTYSVNAIDAAGLKSDSTSISMATKCVFISCTASVQ